MSIARPDSLLAPLSFPRKQSAAVDANELLVQPSTPANPFALGGSSARSANVFPPPPPIVDLSGLGSTSGSVATLHSTATVGVETEELSLAGTVLEPGKPFFVDALDPNRPVKSLSVEMESGTAEIRMGLLPPPGSAGYEPPVYGTPVLQGQGTVKSVRVTYGDPSLTDTDYYAIPKGRDGIKPNGTLAFPIPAHRRGQELENINVSFWAPLRAWDPAGRGGKGSENKPTYANWSLDNQRLQRKFVDPNADAGNIPEIDNVYGANATSPSVLGRVPDSVGTHEIRITAENAHIPADEQAMTVQYIRATYRPRGTVVTSIDKRGPTLPANSNEWTGQWVPTGQTFAIDLDPSWKIRRVEVQWSDKPDTYGYEQPGKWADASVLLDGQPLGDAHAHVGSPEWRSFENFQHRSGSKLEIRAEKCPVKIYQVRIHRDP